MSLSTNKQNQISYQSLVSALWVFASLNYLYCDVIGLMDSRMLNQFITGTVNGMNLTERYLTVGVFLMEIPMAMGVLSKLLAVKPNRTLNIVAGCVMTLVQTASVVAIKPALYYLVMSIVEIGTTLLIVILSVRKRKMPVA